MSEHVQHLAKSFVDTVAGRMRHETDYMTPRTQLGRVVSAKGPGAPVIGIGKERIKRQSYRVAKSVPLGTLKRGDEVLMMETYIGTLVLVALIRTDRDTGDRSSLPKKTKHTCVIGDGSATSFTIDHQLGTRAISVSVWDKNTNQLKTNVYSSITASTDDSITIVFNTAPTAKQYRIVIQ